MTPREIRLWIEQCLRFPPLAELLQVLQDAEEREDWISPEDFEESRAQWAREAEEAAEEAKKDLETEISRHDETRDDLRNTEEDLLDLTKRYDALENDRNRVLALLAAEQEKNAALSRSCGAA